MNKFEICTIELNLNDDFANPSAWHVDSYIATASKNIDAAQEGREIAKWVLVGLENSIKDAVEYIEKLRESMIRQRNQEEDGEKNV